jgi:tetratricopeptide (TPR) repeat protein
MAGCEARHFRLRTMFRVHAAEASDRIARFPLADPAAALGTGLALINGDHAEALLPLAHRLAQAHPASAQAHQLLGLAARAATDSLTACEAFAAAAALAPRDALIAHSRARTALEAGQPAAALFTAATTLAPQDGSVILGHAAALFHEGRTADAIARLETMLAAHPLWIDGHRSLAALRGQMGEDPLASVAAALASHPGAPELHYLAIAIALQARDLPRAEAAAQAARAALGETAWLNLNAGHIASESGALAEADAHFAAAGAPGDPGAAWMHARHLIRAARPEAAAALLEPMLGQPGAHALWPYLSLAWRMTADPRALWLEGDPRLVGVYDIGLPPADLAALADHLRALHVAKAAPLDQSVRGGTQTDGNLLLRTEAPIRDLKARLAAIVAQHVVQLPAAEQGHPTLIARRMPQRIAGSWSVRLEGAGFHTDHVHPQGWFSSALYLAVPQTLGSGGEIDHAGWLSLGEARDLVPGLAPYRLVEPRPGRLVLFPSTMWHGTRPFPAGERLTIAFDIARPRQDIAP